MLSSEQNQRGTPPSVLLDPPEPGSVFPSGGLSFPLAWPISRSSSAWWVSVWRVHSARQLDLKPCKSWHILLAARASGHHWDWVILLNPLSERTEGHCDLELVVSNPFIWEGSEGVLTVPGQRRKHPFPRRNPSIRFSVFWGELPCFRACFRRPQEIPDCSCRDDHWRSRKNGVSRCLKLSHLSILHRPRLALEVLLPHQKHGGVVVPVEGIPFMTIVDKGVQMVQELVHPQRSAAAKAARRGIYHSKEQSSTVDSNDVICDAVVSSNGSHMTNHQTFLLAKKHKQNKSTWKCKSSAICFVFACVLLFSWYSTTSALMRTVTRQQYLLYAPRKNTKNTAKTKRNTCENIANNMWK